MTDKIKLPKGTSQLDYLWQNFGGYTVSQVISGSSENALVSEAALNQYLEENKPILASDSNNGLMSSSDKIFLDSVPEIYATKEQLKDATTGFFQYKGNKTFYGDLDTSAEMGDTWTITYPFIIDNIKYKAGTSVMWLHKWVPVTTDFINGNYITWEADGDTKVVFIPGELDNITIVKALDGYILIGNTDYTLDLQSKNRPQISTGEGILYIAYLSDIGIIDLSNYSDDCVISYIPEFTLEIIDTLGNPTNVYGNYILNHSYLAVSYEDKYDIYNVDNYIPNNILPILKYMREEYLNSLILTDYE